MLESANGQVLIATATDTDQLLVLADSYHPGWSVTVDGQEVRLLRICGDFMGCVVPAGKHLVRFAWRPASLRYGRLLSLIGLAGLIGLSGLAGYGRRLLPAIGPCEQ